MIQLKYCTIERTAFGSVIRYPDGTESGNWPHQTDFYKWVVSACGHTDEKLYCFEHEFCHAFLPEVLFDRTSYIVWQNAHKLPIDDAAGEYEEQLIFYFQQFLRDKIDMSFDPKMVEAKEKAWRLLADEYLLS